MPAITVPRLGWSMEEGTFVRWLKAGGEHVSPGDPLFELESDKSTEVIEAIDSGVLYVPDDGPKPGDRVKVGQVLGLLMTERTSSAPEQPTAARRAGRIAITPRARRSARELGVDWRGLRGSGRGGRIRERDVRLAVVGVEAEGRLVQTTSIRQIIAARMVAGVTKAAPVTLTTKADVTDLVALRAATPAAPSYLAFFIQTVAVALRQHPALRTQWRDDGLFVPERIHVAFAVDTDAGLLAPVVRDADRASVSQIDAQCKDLAAKARTGTLPADAMRGAVFTLSNLGAFGVEAFTPIIQLPQCAVLGTGRIAREPAVVGDQIVLRDRMVLSLTFDHRITDGAPAARFLDAVRGRLERPAPSGAEREGS